MRIIIIQAIALASILMMWGCSGRGGVKESQSADQRVAIADPFILCHNGVYYAYGTGAESGIEVFYSDSLGAWRRNPQLALDRKDSYGERWFWAPEVYLNPIDNKFYLFYSAQEHLCVATADSPMGPFRQREKKPMLEEKSIDSSLFIDSDGTPYIYFVRFTDGNVIWVAELESDWMTIKRETLKQCIVAEFPWELEQGKVVEGPSVIKKDGIYYMVYSANHFESQGYCVGYAISDSPMGEWVKNVAGPILQKPSNGLLGSGHGAIFKDKQGRDMYVFHAHWDKDNVQPRSLHIAEMNFDQGRVSIAQKSIISPILLE